MEENRKHHSFRKGLICGVLISVLTVSVCGCGAAWMLGHLGLTALTSGGNAEEQAKISTKMQELQSYIDRFHLLYTGRICKLYGVFQRKLQRNRCHVKPGLQYWNYHGCESL